MSGKEHVARKTEPRDVQLLVDGEKVDLNGYVMDVFQEVLVGLVRALGDENADGEIQVTIGANKTP